MKDAHTRRVMKEFKAAGVTWYGMTKFSIRYARNIVHEDEHITGVVYGRYKEPSGPPLNEGLLIATDKRILFLDHKPGFTKTEEITYDVVSGVSITTAIFSSITLRTRAGDYTLRFINPKCAHKFFEYVERHQIAKIDY